MKTINLYRMFNSDTIRSRTTATLILNDISKFKSEKIVLDFENINFVSRSFAHELLSNLNKDNVNFEFVNTNNTIDAIFKIALIKPKFVFSTPVKKKILIKI